MKRVFIPVILCLLCFCAQAQNMVPNCSFENYSSCPSTLGQISNCTGWRMYHGGSSDYYNCTSATAGTPINYAGYQVAAHGTGYGGVITYNNPSSTYKEYLARPITPLTIGATYEVSMSVVLSNLAGYSSNDLGVLFYDNGPTTSIGGSGFLTVTPQVSYVSSGRVTDTINWVRLSGLFTADSAYDNIVIGGFGNLTTTYQLSTGFGATSVASYAYYLIDSVVVKLASGINNQYPDSMICAGDTFQVPYTLNLPSLYTTGNVFTAQLSNSSGTFTSGTTTIGTRTATTAGSITCVVPNTITPGSNYRIRIVSSIAVDSSGANQYPLSVGVVRPVKPVASNNGPLCTGSTLNLTANSSTSGVTYKWTGPASFSSALQNPSITSVTTANSGAYIVAARLYGCVSKDTTTVSVSSVSATSLTANANTPLCERDTLKLSATAGSTPNSWSWAGPGSYTSISQNPNILNAMPAMSGDYIVTAFYTGCSVKDTVTVLVNPLAANRTISSNSPVCTGRSLNLNAGSSSSGVGYTWTGPNSFITTTQNPTITGVTSAAAGNYVVSYLLSGCIVKDSLTVVVNTSPLPVNATTNAPICEPDTLRLFCSNSTTGATYSWSGPGSYNSNQQNPKRGNSTTAMTGDYIVIAALSNGCTQSDTVFALVKPLPANFAAGNNGPVCAGNTLQLTGASTSGGVSWNWSGPNSFSSFLQTPTIGSATPSATGTYTLTATLNGCSIVATTYATVNPLPATPSASANSPVCIGQDMKLYASAVPGASYEWTGPSGYNSNAQNPIRLTATTAMAGNYYVRSLLNGCYSSNSSVTVNVVTAPNVTVYPSPKDSICQGATLNLIATPSNAGTNPQYKWYKNNSFITGASTATYTTNTTVDMDVYFCSITATGICSDPYTDSSNGLTIHVLPWLAPAVSITVTPTGTVASGALVTFNAFPVNGGKLPQYQWKRNNANVIGAISNTWGAYNLSNKDLICVEMTSNYLCPNPATAKSNCIEVSIQGGQGSGIAGTQWTLNPPKIYPNPTKDKIIIEGIHKGVNIILTDVLGRTVVNTIAANEMELVDVLTLVPGNYMLRLISDDVNTLTVKIVKQ